MKKILKREKIFVDPIEQAEERLRRIKNTT